jgi:hypothetical protein
MGRAFRDAEMPPPSAFVGELGYERIAADG